VVSASCVPRDRRRSLSRVDSEALRSSHRTPRRSRPEEPRVSGVYACGCEVLGGAFRGCEPLGRKWLHDGPCAHPHKRLRDEECATHIVRISTICTRVEEAPAATKHLGQSVTSSPAQGGLEPLSRGFGGPAERHVFFHSVLVLLVTGLLGVTVTSSHGYDSYAVTSGSCEAMTRIGTSMPGRTWRSKLALLPRASAVARARRGESRGAPAPGT
jgi:hypothetical protein